MSNARLLADGVPVTLADGSTVQLRFDIEAMMRLEDRYGIVGDYLAKLRAGGVYSAVYAGLQIGVVDRTIVAADLDTKEILTYQVAIVDALVQALPTFESKPGGAEDSEGKANGEVGTGSGSTTSPSSPSAAPSMSGVA
jgi:hypothetical protein